ncbi:fad binding domain-containing [Trichoderma arundinaceum]|uniref:Fad binding domain-containing n=1 Tax=Trichoderma arundinaceum TaxID=490622 RepID=A0A395NF05_TRIAR|nr:fad binding domain-containing [Trichoderma arundinaceum]
MGSVEGVMEQLDAPVLVVGGGPVGLLSAYMLSKLGIKSLLIEKYTNRLAAPKAHALCPRSLEICRQFGLDTNAMRRIGSPRDDACWVNFVTNLSGERIGVLPYERMDADVLDSTPELTVQQMIHNIPQPDFEAFVAKQLEGDPNVKIRKNVAFLSCKQKGNEVFSTLEDRATKTRCVVRSRHVMGCDGASSAVRKDLGIECEGEDGFETMMTIHFKADLRPIVGDRVGMLHWITDPACSGFIIAYDLSGNQVLISNFDASRTFLSPLYLGQIWTKDLARSTVSAALGCDAPFEVLSYRPWILSRKVAKEYRKGNVFLVGDAAHAFPPTGGLGLNSGLADAHNLAYKIAAVQKGWAGPRLLDTYEADRRQIALINSAQSIKNGKKIFSFLKTLGTAGIADVEDARANLLRSIHDPAKQGMIAEEVEGQREHFDNLGIHIGYVYGDKATPANASVFSPQFVPGARLPHAWVQPRASSQLPWPQAIDVSYAKELGPQDIKDCQYSTLDMVHVDSFTIIAESARIWGPCVQDARVKLQKRAGMAVKIRLVTLEDDFEFVDRRQADTFECQCGLSDGKAMVVRPDQHIVGIIGLGDGLDSLSGLIRGQLEL